MTEERSGHQHESAVPGSTTSDLQSATARAMSAGAARTVLSIPGLERDLRILHITDSHMAVGDERDPEAAGNT